MHAWTVGLAVVALMPLPGTAGAQDAASAPRLSTQEEYLACLLDGERIEAGQARIAARAKAHEERALKFQAADDDLAAQVKRHAPSTAKEIASYNRAVTRRNAQVEELNRDAMALQREQAAMNRLVFERNERCGGRLIDAELKEAAEAEFRRRRRD